VSRVVYSKPFWLLVIVALFIVGYVVYPRESTPSEVEPESIPAAKTVTDIDGNVYKTIKIGNQTWMAENLRATKLNDGQSISYKSGALDWASLSTPGYCWPDNDALNGEDYGALYNWYSVDSEKLAPEGWHVPTEDEWQTLIDYLGGEKVAGGELKKMNFTVNFAGVRTYSGEFGYIDEMEKYWTATEGGWHAGDAWYYTVTKFDSELGKSSHMKMDGHSVRCMKDD